MEDDASTRRTLRHLCLTTTTLNCDFQKDKKRAFKREQENAWYIRFQEDILKLIPTGTVEIHKYYYKEHEIDEIYLEEIRHYGDAGHSTSSASFIKTEEPTSVMHGPFLNEITFQKMHIKFMLLYTCTHTRMDADSQ